MMENHRKNPTTQLGDSLVKYDPENEESWVKYGN